MEEKTADDNRWLLGGLKAMFEEKRHCDVNICIGEEKFACHKVVLSAASKYFDAMFASGMRESEENFVNIKDIDEGTFSDILDYIYTDNDVVSADNVEGLLRASCLLQMPHLESKCTAFMKVQISPENAIGIWCVAKSLNCEDLVKAAWEFILLSFDQAVKYDEFIKLEKDDFLDIIKSDDLLVSSEEVVCAAALKWLKAKGGDQNIGVEMLSLLKLSQISMDFLMEHIYSEPIFHSDQQSMKLLKNAVKYHALPEKRHMNSYMDIKLRHTSDYSSIYMFLGCTQHPNTGASRTTDVLAYDTHKQKWYAFCSMPFEIGEEYATCPYGNDVYISGGTANPRVLLKFSAKQCRWLEKPSMCEGRYKHCMLAVKDSLYCIGGYNNGTVGGIEEFDMSTDTWQSVGKLKYAVDSASAVPHEDNILIFGGWEGLSEESSAIQCFNTSTRTCTIIGHLPSPQRDTRAISFNNKIYVMFSTGEIMQYEPNKPLRMLHKIENFHKKNFGLVKMEKTLYVLGGTDLHEDKSEDCDGALSNEILAFPPEIQDGCVAIQGPLPRDYEVYGFYHMLVKTKYPLVEVSEQFAW